MRKYYIYHHNDHDGIVAAGVLYNLLLKKIPFFSSEDAIFNMIDYQQKLNFDMITSCDEVYFLDYSFSNKHNIDMLEKLIQRVGNDNIYWIDHHKTSMGVLEEYNIPGIRMEGLCGAALTYLFCMDLLSRWSKESYASSFHNSESIPKFLKYIDDYDCWKQLYPETNDFHYGFTISDPKDARISVLLNPVVKSAGYIGSILSNIIEKGKGIQEYLKFENKEYHIDMYGFEFTLPEEHGGYKCFCLNRKGNSLMFGDKIKEYDAVIPFYYINGRWTYSMFTAKDGVDCEAVARSYGGGGHLRAAGWTSDELIFDKK